MHSHRVSVGFAQFLGRFKRTDCWTTDQSHKPPTDACAPRYDPVRKRPIVARRTNRGVAWPEEARDAAAIVPHEKGGNFDVTDLIRAVQGKIPPRSHHFRVVGGVLKIERFRGCLRRRKGEKKNCEPHARNVGSPAGSPLPNFSTTSLFCLACRFGACGGTKDAHSGSNSSEDDAVPVAERMYGVDARSSQRRAVLAA